MKLQDIPVTVQSDSGTGSDSAFAPALLSEIADHLDHFLKSGEPALIDLGSLPMGAIDRAALIKALGQGEVHIVVNALGRSEARETGYPGVWWVEHHSPDGTRVAEHVEIAAIPQIAPAHLEDVGNSLGRLREQLEPGEARQ